jgi:transcription elongation factor Elf1
LSHQLHVALSTSAANLSKMIYLVQCKRCGLWNFTKEHASYLQAYSAVFSRYEQCLARTCMAGPSGPAV